MSMEAGSNEQDVSWCKKTKSDHGVVFGKSFGTMPRDQQKKWEQLKCNELIRLGRHQSCDQRRGWSFFENWLAKTRLLTSGGVSAVNCSVNMKSATFCRMQNVVVDFSQMVGVGGVRQFRDGTFTVHTKEDHGLAGVMSFVPGLTVKHDSATIPPSSAGAAGAAGADGVAHQALKAALGCEEVEPRPTFVVSHDDPYNLAHNMNDVIAVWASTVLARRAPADSVLINMDGFRVGGPAGGAPHRIIRPSDPDALGPFNAGYYPSWFHAVRKSAQYGKKKVCFNELYLPVMPGVPWIWGDWSAPSDCAAKAPSPLYQSFNVFLRHRWADARGPHAVAAPDTDRVHLVIAVRAIEAHKSKESSARYVKNMAVLLDAVRTIPGVRVTVQDFAQIDFAAQVNLSHSAGVLLSMHGAGVTQIVHSSVGSPNCCALIELFPDRSTGFHTIWGFGNLARHLGMHYYRYEAKDGKTDGGGTTVNVPEVRALVQHAVESVRTAPSCLQRVKDTRVPVPAWD